MFAGPENELFILRKSDRKVGKNKGELIKYNIAKDALQNYRNTTNNLTQTIASSNRDIKEYEESKEKKEKDTSRYYEHHHLFHL